MDMNKDLSIIFASRVIKWVRIVEDCGSLNYFNKQRITSKLRDLQYYILVKWKTTSQKSFIEVGLSVAKGFSIILNDFVIDWD